LGQIAESRFLAITICGILQANLKTTRKNSETFGQIADKRAQTLGITIRSILEVNFKTNGKKQRNFEKTRRQ